MRGYAPMLDEMLGVYSIDRTTVHLVITLTVLAVLVAAIAGAVYAVRMRNAAFRAGLDSDYRDLQRNFGTWRDGYLAAGDTDDDRLDLIETIGIDLLGVYRARPITPPAPPAPPVVPSRTITFGD
ncbi:hypothetical protein [Mycobacteroides abscessus]|uniref:hypothetical protein n=1 Tax=Mycobacteroides abscessus TaxID=36809 RepID=UPI0012FFE59E|nr:hypothetical protein [Mycobacteroides abscessus]